MPKTDDTFDPADYAPVAERITLFYGQHPGGRIVTRALRITERIVVFRAAVYRSGDDRRPAATGWASERPGDGEINTVACVENTETSAIGRALANLGLTAGRQRPSREEMEKARRRRTPGAPGARRTPEASALGDARALASEHDLAELEERLAAAERRGFPPERIEEIRALLARGRAASGSPAHAPEPIVLLTVRALSRELGAWLARAR